MQIRVPPTPSTEAMRRAWPPAPKVQSTASCPGCGASSSTSSVARTGLCSIGITERVPCSRARPADAGPVLPDGELAAWRTWAGISRRPPQSQALGDLGRGRVELLLLLGPGLGVPDLQVLAGA